MSQSKEQPEGSYHLVGTGAVVNNRASQVDASNNNSYPPPSPSPNIPSRVGAGIGFAFVAIAIGAVLVWKRYSSSSIIGTKVSNNTHIGSVKRNEKDPRIRRGGGKNRKTGTNGSGGPRKDMNENRTIYDSDCSLDSDFDINRRMRIDPINSDSASAFEINKRMKIDPPVNSDIDSFFEINRRMRIDPVNSDSDSESSNDSVTPHRNRAQNP